MRRVATAKRYWNGTHRSRDPARTLARARQLMPRLGITRLANLTGLDVLGIPVHAAIRPNGRSLSTSQGKGTTHVAAQASALMESIETWHAEHLVLPVVRSSWQAMTRPHVDPRRLARAAPLASGQSWRWVPGQELMSGRELWVPEQAVSLDCVFDAAPVFDVSSNGLASGNHRLEAIVHGLCEVVERDAEASWRAERGQRRVDPAAVREPGCRALIARLHAAKVHVTVWDLTSDIGLPVYGAAIMEDPREPAWRALGLYQGFGCHLDAGVALSRALCEAAQTRLTYIAGSRDDFFDFDYARATDPELLEEIWHQVTRPIRRPVEHARAPRLATPTLEGDLEVVLERLAAAGVKQAIAVDLGRPELGIPVVKTIIPGRATRVELMG
jgi:ribosomal protein S12 methylthiotransferase accessory factor